MAEVHEGSCHCGAVTYAVETSLDGLVECNCSHCYRKGFVLAFAPRAAFTLKSGEDQLGEYRFNKHNIAHMFCKTCGVQPFGFGTGRGRPVGGALRGLAVPRSERGPVATTAAGRVLPGAASGGHGAALQQPAGR